MHTRICSFCTERLPHKQHLFFEYCLVRSRWSAVHFFNIFYVRHSKHREPIHKLIPVCGRMNHHVSSYTVVNACSRQATVFGTHPFSCCSTWRFRCSLLRNKMGTKRFFISTCVLFSSQHPRHFGRYSIVLNRFT